MRHLIIFDLRDKSDFALGTVRDSFSLDLNELSNTQLSEEFETAVSMSVSAYEKANPNDLMRRAVFLIKDSVVSETTERFECLHTILRVRDQRAISIS